MSMELADLFTLQLAQQASLYNITHNYGRRQSAERVEKFFYKILELLPVSKSIEIGAHEATFSRNVKKFFAEKIHASAYEANPLVYSHFLLDGELRKAGVEYCFSAIGNRDGSTAFQIYEAIRGKKENFDSRRHSCLLRADSPDDRHYAINVPVARLDTLCGHEAQASIYALWIDAEGFGREVLEGAENTLNNTAAIYMELESKAHFQGQALDVEIMAYLLGRDFLPILRDFLFPHQYNAIFVKKEYLQDIEQEWHRFFQGVLGQELSAAFNIPIIPQENIRKRPPVLQTQKLENVEDLRSVMDSLPLLRPAREQIDPAKAVVACHFSELEAAVAWHRERYSQLPIFYPLDLPMDERNFASAPGQEHFTLDCAGQTVKIGDFQRLTQAMDIQVFFMQHRRPGQTPFARLAQGLKERGIEKYSIEAWSMADFYLRNSHANYSDGEWKTMLAFYNLLADSKSQYAYLAVCKARMLGDPGFIPLADYPQYEHPLLETMPHDIFCEGGCAPFYEPGIGVTNTTANFAGIIGEEGEIWAFEPVPETFNELKALFHHNNAVHIEPYALWEHAGRLKLSGSGSGAFTTLSDEGDCPCVSVDNFFADKKKPTVIKLDVEGAELETLKGAVNTIMANAPKMMVSIYHSRPARDWTRIPSFFLALAPNYDFYCGHHRPWFNETVLYAKPNEKRQK